MTSLSSVTEEVVSPLSSLMARLGSRLGEEEGREQEEILRGLSDVEEDEREEGSRVIIMALRSPLSPQTLLNLHPNYASQSCIT